MINNRKEIIKKKGFSILSVDNDSAQLADNQTGFVPVDFSKLKIGNMTLDNAVLNLSTFQNTDSRLGRKENILKAIHDGDIVTQREISNYFFNISGIYSRLCKYMAYMYRYDWMVTPYINDTATDKDEDNALAAFYKILLFLDNSELKKTFGEIALKVIKDGCFYGFLQTTEKRAYIQELPVNYCRSRFFANGRPVVEFNMRYFDLNFKDIAQRMKILDIFPKEFKKGYVAYKKGKLVPQFPGDTAG